MSVAFVGSKQVGLYALRQMLEHCRPCVVICPNDEGDERSVMAEFRDLAEREVLPLTIAETSADMYEALAPAQPHVVIVAGWYRIINTALIPGTKYYGLHFSLLPEYRGNAPLVWQLMNGESHAGVSLFQIAPGLDEGDIIGQASFPVSPDATIKDALEQAEQASCNLLAEHLPALIAGTAEHKPQDHSQATFCGLRVPEDGRIDWTWPAEKIHNFVRAQSHPYPGAFTQLPDGKTVHVWRTRVHPRPYFGVPGAVAERHPDHVIITCGDGAILVSEAQIEGEAPTPTREIFTSLRMRLR